MGDALVGLQRVFSESERPDLSAGGSMLRSGRYAAQLLSAPVLHAGVSPDQAPMADGSLRRPAGSLYFGYNLLCGMASHRPGHCVVNVPACVDHGGLRIGEKPASGSGNRLRRESCGKEANQAGGIGHPDSEIIRREGYSRRVLLNFPDSHIMILSKFRRYCLCIHP